MIPLPLTPMTTNSPQTRNYTPLYSYPYYFYFYYAQIASMMVLVVAMASYCLTLMAIILSLIDYAESLGFYYYYYFLSITIIHPQTSYYYHDPLPSIKNLSSILTSSSNSSILLSHAHNHSITQYSSISIFSSAQYICYSIYGL